MATQGVVHGIVADFSTNEEVEKCSACLEGKMERKPFPTRTKPLASNLLDLLHTDLCGPITPTSKGGARYILTLLNDTTRTGRFPTPPNKKHSIVVIPPTVDDTDESSTHGVPEDSGAKDEEGDVVEVVGVESEKDGGPSTVVAPTLASTRAPHPNPKYADYSFSVEDDEEGGDAMCFMADFTPTTYREAMETLQADN
ncbi:unnamed protein product [Closterium sp. Naga37s-1]|nr:unnamed protein product [Closterium sp. Naga37s-1]CAI5527249.1 unnamed protein product [Closterium sp. Naga37s-1]CAI5531700.1 unnamed protein product [Closterium sp. Naga37s-1]